MAIDCPRCQEPILDSAHSFPCGHLVCHQCEDRFSEGEGDGDSTWVSCPLCEARFDKDSFTSACIREVLFDSCSGSDGGSLNSRAEIDAETIRQLEGLLLRSNKERDDLRAEAERRIHAREETFSRQMDDRHAKLQQARESFKDANKKVEALERDMRGRDDDIEKMKEYIAKLMKDKDDMEQMVDKKSEELDRRVSEEISRQQGVELMKRRKWKSSGLVLLFFLFGFLPTYLALIVATIVIVLVV